MTIYEWPGHRIVEAGGGLRRLEWETTDGRWASSGLVEPVVVAELLRQRDNTVAQAQLAGDLRARVGELAARIERSEERGAAPWRELVEQLALALNCLPSTFPDAYGHVFQQIASLRSNEEGGAGRRKVKP